jgi:hypothetical protein
MGRIVGLASFGTLLACAVVAALLFTWKPKKHTPAVSTDDSQVVRNDQSSARTRLRFSEIGLRDTSVTVEGANRIRIRGVLETTDPIIGASVALELLARRSGNVLLRANAEVDARRRFDLAVRSTVEAADRVTVGAARLKITLKHAGDTIARLEHDCPKLWSIELERRQPFPVRDRSGLLIQGRLHSRLDIADFELFRRTLNPVNPDEQGRNEVVTIPLAEDGTFESETGGGESFVRLYREGIVKIIIEVQFRNKLIDSTTYPRQHRRSRALPRV